MVEVYIDGKFLCVVDNCTIEFERDRFYDGDDEKIVTKVNLVGEVSDKIIKSK